MDKKTKTIILILITLGIWGYSALEWYNYVDASDSLEIESTSTFAPVSPPLLLKQNEQAKLKLNYRDPFLNETKNKPVKKTNSINKTRVIKPVKITPIVEEVKWPEIEYAGVINNSLGLLKINGKDYIVKENDIKNQVKVISCLPSKVVLTFNNQIKEVFKKQ